MFTRFSKCSGAATILIFLNVTASATLAGATNLFGMFGMEHPYLRGCGLR